MAYTPWEKSQVVLMLEYYLDSTTRDLQKVKDIISGGETEIKALLVTYLTDIVYVNKNASIVDVDSHLTVQKADRDFLATYLGLTPPP